MVDCAIVVQLGHDAHVEIERSSMRVRVLSHSGFRSLRPGNWERDYRSIVDVDFDLGFCEINGVL